MVTRLHMEFLPKCRRDIIETLQVRFWLTPFIGAGGEVMIKAARYLLAVINYSNR
jgi:hypothetical protein